MSADREIAAIVETLALAPHPEGGFFCETYRSALRTGGRALATAIYFLVTAQSPSRMHRVASDEIWHYYAGDELEMLQLAPDGSSQTIAIGNDIERGARPQVLVRGGFWQGVRVRPGGRYGLVGATVTPGFDYADFELGDREALLTRYPGERATITALT